MKTPVALSVGSLLLGVVACSSPNDAAERTETVVSALGEPAVITGPATEIGQTHARLPVTVTDRGAADVTECGVCWGPPATIVGLVDQTSAYGVRCMRQFPCLNRAYYTNDGYMAQAPYNPGATYNYRAYAVNAAGIGYSNQASFTVPKVNTGAATEISQTNARLGVTASPGTSSLSECGVCWGPAGGNINFVEQTGSDGVRCMRQFPCLNRAYYTSDGYMAQAPYNPGATYDYRGYAINDAGVAYGTTKSFTVPNPCIYYFTAVCYQGPVPWVGIGTNPPPQPSNYSVTYACGTSLDDAFVHNLPTGYTKCNSTNALCCSMTSGGTIPH
jgi:hypothetical protein